MIQPAALRENYLSSKSARSSGSKQSATPPHRQIGVPSDSLHGAPALPQSGLDPASSSLILTVGAGPEALYADAFPALLDRMIRRASAAQFRFVSRERRAPEELYDLENDPYELNNLVGSKAHADILRRMRRALRESMIAKRDLGFIPEYEMHKRAGKEAPYTLGLDRKQHDPEQLLDILDLVLQPDNYLDDNARMSELRRMLEDKDSLVRYWASVVLTDFAVRNEKKDAYVPEFTKMLGDESEDIRLVACAALVQLGKPEAAVDCLSKLLTHEDSLVRMRTCAVLMSYPPARSAPLLNKIRRAAAQKPLFEYAALLMKWYVQELKRPQRSVGGRK